MDEVRVSGHEAHAVLVNTQQFNFLLCLSAFKYMLIHSQSVKERRKEIFYLMTHTPILMMMITITYRMCLCVFAI